MSERGSLTVEAVLLVPVVVLFLVVTLSFARVETARAAVTAAAADGAAAASVAPTASAAVQTAARTVELALAGMPGGCLDDRVSTDVGDFVPGGRVRVDVSCTVGSATSQSPNALTGARVEATASAPIDPYRAVLP